MAMSDRLIELFLGSMRTDTAEIASAEEVMASFPGGCPDDEAIDRGLANLDKMLTSEDALKMMMGNPAATFVCLAMQLEDRPTLGTCAVRVYEKGLEWLGQDASWERCMVLKQLGAVCVRQEFYQDAKRWLQQCAEQSKSLSGHPRDAVLLNGSFSTKETRMEFCATVEKIRAQAFYKLGDKDTAMKHLTEAQRMEAEAAGAGDAVERVDRTQTARAVGSTTPATSSASQPKVDPVKELWNASPKEEKRLKHYSFADEGSTVTLIVDLNEHLGIGDEASEQVESLRQFRVHCELTVVDIQLRLRRRDGSVWHFCLHLDPLVHEIVAEDTVPKLRGKETRRRLEVKLFKKDKKTKWLNDLVRSGQAAKPKAVAPAAKNTLLNPLTAEELARLPTPAACGASNRPSTWNAYQEESAAEPIEKAAVEDIRKNNGNQQLSDPAPDAVLDAMD